MKIIFLIFLIIPSLGYGAAFDMFISQRNIANSATLTRTIPLPELGVNSVFGTSYADNLPVMWKLGPTLGVSGGEIGANLDWLMMYNKPVFATVATSGDYNDLINKPSGAQVNSDWSAISGPAEILNKPTTLAGYGISDAYPLSGNPSGFLTGITSSQVTSALGFAPYSDANPSGFVSQSGARSAVSLTTTGTGGAATYNSATGVLNVPNYAPGTGTVTSVTAGTGLSGGTITTSGTISLPSIGTAGSYSGVTTDAQGRVTAGTSRSQSSPARTLNSTFQISTTRDAFAAYSVQCVITASIAGGQSCDVILEIATDAAFTTGVQTVGVVGTGQTYTLAIALQGVQPQTTQLTGYVPAGYYARIRTVSVTGAPTFLLRASQEILQ